MLIRWKNLAETNIMIGSHADSLIASAVTRNVTGFDLALAYEAVKKNADVPPLNDTTTLYVLSVYWPTASIPR